MDGLVTNSAALRAGAVGGWLYRGKVPTQMIVLNGGSSSGKSEIARCLQAVLPEPWLSTGVDRLIEAMPASMQMRDAGIDIGADGAVSIGPEFSRLQKAWMEGVAAAVRAGAPVILDDVFLGGAGSQQRWQRVLGGLTVLWVGIKCDSAIAAAREAARGDRVRGMAALQAEVVHQGVVYDLEVDTSYTESLVCARTIAARIS